MKNRNPFTDHPDRIEILRSSRYIELLFRAEKGNECILLRHGSDSSLSDLSTLSAALIAAVYNAFLDHNLPLEAEEYRAQLMEKLQDDYFWTLPIRFQNDSDSGHGPLN